MIVFKQWKKRSKFGIQVHAYEGWFLFGIIPLYIRRLGCY
jgi:hypothetical protein